MNKILQIFLVFIFSLTIISCGEDGGSWSSEDTSSTTTTDDDSTTSDTTTGCCSSGSATIKGLVADNDSDALSGVSVSFAKSGTTSSTVTTEDNGTYSISTLSSGTYTLSYRYIKEVI